MAKKRRRRGKQGLFSKALNASLIALGFSRVISILVSPAAIDTKMTAIINGATFGLATGKFNLDIGLRMYTPAGAAIALGTLKTFLMRKFPVR